MPMRILAERKRSSLARLQPASWVIAAVMTALIAADPEHRLPPALFALFARLSGLILSY